MAWRYTFDGGDEKPLEASSLYQVAAMKAFASEDVFLIPQITATDGVVWKYEGHVVKLWDTELVDLYPPANYGLAWDPYGCLKIVMLNREK